jgi:PBSX family phage terminase large subunit
MGRSDGWDEVVESFNKQSLTAIFRNGSHIYLRSCDRPDDLRGPNLSWFFIDEAAKTPHNVWKIMLARLRVPPEKGWITTTPRGRNWVWEEFAKKHRKNYEYFTGSTLENTHLSREYKESLIQNYSGSFLAQEVYGEFVGWDGLVYQLEVDKHHEEYNPECFDQYRYAVAGVDWGWIDPTVILVGLVGFDDSIHIVEEYYEKKVNIDQISGIAVGLKEKWGIRTFYCDYARPEYIQELRNVGLDSRKGKKELDPGIACVNNYLDKGLLTIDFNACPETVDEMQSYHYDEDDMGKVLKNRPIDDHNHAMDALRYMVYSHSKRGYVGSQRGYR